MRIKKGDTVMVITGKDKGKHGKVLKAMPKENRVVVEGVNMQTKHAKATRKAGAEIKHLEGPIDASNVMLYDAKVAQEFASRMLEKGVYVVGFCYPVVPQGKARIRTQVSAAHTKEDLDFAVRCFREVKEEMGL